MSHQSYKGKSPILQILEVGLQFWIRSQCKTVGNLKLVLSGSTLELLQGSVAEVSVIAEKVNFIDLPLHYIELKSGPIKVNLNQALKNQRISFKEVFHIEGSVSLIGNEIEEALLSEQWNWLGKWLAKELLGDNSLESLTFSKDSIKLVSSNTNCRKTKEGEFKIRLNSGDIIIESKDQKIQALLPMDPSIKINKAMIKDGEFILTGHSIVTQ